MKKKLKIFLAIFTTLALFFSAVTPSLALDLSEYFVLGKGGETVSTTYSNPAILVNVVVRNLFVLAGIILFFLIIYSGFQFVSQDKKGIEEAKKIMTTAIAGFIIMFAAFWIVQIAEIVTGVDIIL